MTRGYDHNLGTEIDKSLKLYDHACLTSYTDWDQVTKHQMLAKEMYKDKNQQIIAFKIALKES